jgi:peptide/nickel transport system permease protein
MARETVTKPGLAIEDTERLAQDELRRLRRFPLWQVRLRLLGRSLAAQWRLFAEQPIGLIGLAIIVCFGAFALLHPLLMGRVWPRVIYDPIIGYDPAFPAHPVGPSAAHWLGTDPLGRDVLSQLMFGTGSAFTLGITAALVTVLIGTTVGAVAGYFGGAIDTFFMRLADLVIILPFIVILIVLGALFELNLLTLAVVIGVLGGFGGTAIVIKSQALTVKVRAYIEAARVAGGGHGHIILRHIIPNLLPLSFLYMMFGVTEAIAAEATLSFFGLLDVRMSWGLMIHTANTAGYLLNFSTWWLILPAGLSITLLSAAFYFVGRAMDEVVNPRLRRR